jgi:arylsulfatase A
MDHSRRDFLKLTGGAAAAGWLATRAWSEEASAKGGARPNIVFILADDLGIGHVGCYGSAYRTPHLDALAKEGMRFEYCYAAPLCAPTRAECLTGRYPLRTGVLDNGSGAKAHPSKETSIAKVLLQAGYATAFSGKWRQLQYLDTPEEGLAWGFQEFLRWDKSKGERYWNPAYSKDGKMFPVTPKDYGPDLLHEFAVGFMERHKDQPFFLYYPMVLIHGPLLRTPDSARNPESLLADNVAYMDKLVGKLVAELERLKLREKTLLVFVGDNGSVGGGMIGDKKIDGGKGSLKEGGSRVPLIVSWRGTTPAAQVSQDLIDISDFFPTFAEIAGVALPPGVQIDGHSFAPQLRGQKGKPREWVYVQLGNQRYVRDARHKLYDSGQFCDMSNAPFGETVIRAGQEKGDAAAAKQKLQAALQPFLPPPPAETKKA